MSPTTSGKSHTWTARGALRALARVPHRVAFAVRRASARVHPAPVFALGNQKSGTTAITALLSEATGASVTLDIFHELPPGVLTGLLERKIRFEDVVRRYRYWFSTPIIKEPSLTFFYEDLRLVFPQAKFLLIVRDPRDNIRSILNRLKLPGDLPDLDASHFAALSHKSGWRLLLDGTLYGSKGANYIETMANRWNQAADVYLEHEDVIVLMRYESFRENKASSIHELARLVGLEPTHDISGRVDVQFQVRGDSGVRWEDFFGSDNLRRIDAICGQRMARFGYRLSSEPQS